MNDNKPVEEKLKEHKTALISEAEVMTCAHHKAGKIVMKVTELQTRPNGNPYIQLTEWKKLGDEIIKYFYTYGTIMSKSALVNEEIATGAERNKNSRWTKEEDERLIDVVCQEGWTPFELSASFGRSIPAIKARVSKLVGLKRVSQEIAGRFFGTIDGVETSGSIEGIVYKREC